MKLAFVTFFDAERLSEWSGIPFHMLRALRKVATSVEVVGPINVPFRIGNKILHKLYGKRGYVKEYNPTFLKDYARAVRQRLQHVEHDAVVAPSLLSIAELDWDKPVALWADATYQGLQSLYYPNAPMCAMTRDHSFRAQYQALHRASLCVLGSQWVVDSALLTYRVPPEKILQLPFGANLLNPPTQSDVQKFLRAKQGVEALKLLIIGVDWHRKGVDLAVQVLERLKALGVPAQLDVVGCLPPQGWQCPQGVQVHGFVDKTSDEGRATINQWLAQAHFLLFPSRAEAFGIVSCEANAFGVPVIASNVGGIPSAVRHGVNGWTFPLDSYVEQAVNIIMEWIADHDAYTKVAWQARREFEQRLNWESSCSQVIQRLETLI